MWLYFFLDNYRLRVPILQGASPEIQAFTSVVQTAIPKRLGVKVATFQAFRSPYFPCYGSLGLRATKNHCFSTYLSTIQAVEEIVFGMS